MMMMMMMMVSYLMLSLYACSMLGALGRVVTFETCCEWELLSVQIATLLFQFTVPKYIYPYVSKVHAGSFRVCIINRTLAWITGSLMCILDHTYVSIYTQGLGTPTASQHNTFDLDFFSSLCL